MSKFKKSTGEKTKNEMSIEMLKDCKKDIAKFGFNPKNEYPKFLISVGAMKDKETVLKYHNSQIEMYREMFLKKNEHSIEDSMQLDKFKIKSSDQDGNQFETGYFAPRSFWDKIYETKID